MLRKVIAYIHTRQQRLAHQRLVLLALAQQAQELVRGLERGRVVGVGDAAEIAGRHFVDDLVLFHAAGAVQVQDRVVGHAVPDAAQALVQAADVDEAARDAQAAPGVAQVRGVGGQEDAADAEGGGAAFWGGVLVSGVGLGIQLRDNPRCILYGEKLMTLY